jgi:transcription-repair coupling factor (superfamily II helicase)
MKAGQQPELDRPLDHGVEINLHIPALIPEDFLPDVHTRLILYKRISSARNKEELIELREEMIDRFGLLPEAVKNLFHVNELKLKANPLGIRKVDMGNKGGRLHFHENANIDPIKIIQLIQTDPQVYKFDGQDKLRVLKKLPDVESRIQALHDLFVEISTRDAA